MRNYTAWYPFIVLMAIDFAFAISNILLKIIVTDGMNHLVFITYRQSISAIFLAPIAFFIERDKRPKLTLSILCSLFLSAIVGASLTQYFFLLGIEYTSATFSCAFLNIVPVTTFLMALPFGLETLNLRNKSGKAKVLGTLVCLGGAILLTLYRGMPLTNNSSSLNSSQSRQQGIPLSSVKKAERWTIGSLALLAGTLLWSSWFLLQSNIGKKYPCQYSSTAIMTFFSAIQTAVLCLSIERNLSIWTVKRKMDIISVMYSGMIGSGLCYVGMSWCVKKRGPVFTAAFSPFVQIMAAMIDVPFLHEEFYMGNLIGSIIVIVGLYILLWGKNKEMQNRDSNLIDDTNVVIKEQEQQQFQVLEVSNDPKQPRL